jgi:hypothetical protein
MSYFFGTYPAEKEVGRLFDLARLIVQPDFARKAHVTLRGPYEKKPSPRSSWLRRPLSKATIMRPSNFFSYWQNTVYLGIDFPELAEVTWKRDFKDSVPHMTVYDGSDKTLAWQILLALRKYTWKFQIDLTPVQILEKKRDYDGSFFLELDDIDIAFSYIHERPLNRDYIRSMHIGQRIHLLEKICVRIHFLKQSGVLF